MELWQALAPRAPAASRGGSSARAAARPGGRTARVVPGRRRRGVERRARRCAPSWRGAGQPATLWWQPEGGAPGRWPAQARRIPATVFEQVNPAMGDRAASPRSLRWGRRRTARCGTSMPASARRPAALRGLGRDGGERRADRRAVAERRATRARRRGAMPARVEARAGRAGAPDLVVTNPPRTGMEARVRPALKRQRPGASCTSRAIPPRWRATSRGCRRSGSPMAPGLRPFSPDGARRDRRRAGGAREVLRELGGREIEIEVDGDRVTVGGRAFGDAHTRPRHAGPAAADRRPVLRVAHRAGRRGRWAVTRARRALRGGGGGRADQAHPQPHRAGERAPRHRRALKAPMPGLVVRIQVEAGAGGGRGRRGRRARGHEDGERAQGGGQPAVVRPCGAAGPSGGEGAGADRVRRSAA